MPQYLPLTLDKSFKDWISCLSFWKDVEEPGWMGEGDRRSGEGGHDDVYYVYVFFPHLRVMGTGMAMGMGSATDAWVKLFKDTSMPSPLPVLLLDCSAILS
eukprot:945088_1